MNHFSISCCSALIILLFLLKNVKLSTGQSCTECSYGSWGSWGQCVCNICDNSDDHKAECIRRRAILTGDDGCDCGETVEIQCGDVCCNSECPTTEWSEWSQCPEQCVVNAYKNRTRSEYSSGCTRECDNLFESVRCVDAECCPVDCQLGTWKKWGDCSVSCQSETGTQTRKRAYTHGVCGGNECSVDDYTETRSCKGVNACESGTGDGENGAGDENDSNNNGDDGEDVDNSGNDDDNNDNGHSESLSKGCITGAWTNWAFCPSGDAQYRTRSTLSGVCGGECSEGDGLESRDYPCEMRIFSKVSASVTLSGELQAKDTNVSIILSMLGPPTNTERQEINTYYKVAYGSELVDELQAALPDYIGLDCLLSLLQSAEDFSANVLIHAIQNHDETVISQVLIQKTNEEVRNINEAYTQLTGKRMDADLENTFNGNNERLLRSLAEGGRDETGSLDESLLDYDIKMLRDSVRKNAGNPRLAQSILATRDFEHLRHVLYKFEETYTRRYRYYLQRNIKGPVMRGFLNIVQAAEDPVLYCVLRIHEALYPSKGNIDENILISTIIDCARNDMCFVREKYFNQYAVELVDDVIHNYDGHCQDVMLAVIR